MPKDAISVIGLLCCFSLLKLTELASDLAADFLQLFQLALKLQSGLLLLLQLSLKRGDIRSARHSTNLRSSWFDIRNRGKLVITLCWKILHLVGSLSINLLLFNSVMLLSSWLLLLSRFVVWNNGTNLIDLEVVQLINSFIYIHFLLLLGENAPSGIAADFASSLRLGFWVEWSRLRFWPTFRDLLVKSLHCDLVELAFSLMDLGFSFSDKWTNLLLYHKSSSGRHLRACFRSLWGSRIESLSWIDNSWLWSISVVALGLNHFSSIVSWRQSLFVHSWYRSWRCDEATLMASKSPWEVTLAHTLLAIGLLETIWWIISWKQS